LTVVGEDIILFNTKRDIWNLSRSYYKLHLYYWWEDKCCPAELTGSTPAISVLQAALCFLSVLVTILYLTLTRVHLASAGTSYDMHST